MNAESVHNCERFDGSGTIFRVGAPIFATMLHPRRAVVTWLTVTRRSTLRLEPRAIPSVRVASTTRSAHSGEHLRRLQNEGFLGEPWLGDEISRHVRDFYNHHVMGSSTGPYAALVAYEAELLRVRDTLRRMEDEYRRTEGDNAELWGRA